MQKDSSSDGDMPSIMARESEIEAAGCEALRYLEGVNDEPYDVKEEGRYKGCEEGKGVSETMIVNHSQYRRCTANGHIHEETNPIPAALLPVERLGEREVAACYGVGDDEGEECVACHVVTV